MAFGLYTQPFAFVAHSHRIAREPMAASPHPLSMSSSRMLPESGLRGPLCGVPSSVRTLTRSTITQVSRYRRMSLRTLLSVTFLATLLIRISWLMRSNIFWVSRSTTQAYPASICFWAALTASGWLRPGRKPRLSSAKPGSETQTQHLEDLPAGLLRRAPQQPCSSCRFGDFHSPHRSWPVGPGYQRFNH